MSDKTLESMTKEERSLLLFLESRVVDQSGLVDTRYMNADDMDIAKRWHTDNFIGFGRLSMKSIDDLQKNTISKSTHWCEFSEEAWELAHKERRARAERSVKSRKWIKSKDK